MNRRYFMFGALGAPLLATTALRPAEAAKKKKKVFVLTSTGGFRHSSIQTAFDTVSRLGDSTGVWEVVGRADNKDEVGKAITAENLKGWDMVFWANTTGDVGMTPEGRAAYYAWVNKGGAYAGVHSAGDTYHGDADYLNLVRGEFQTHGPQKEVEVFVQDPKHPATKDLPATFKIFDEIYEYKNWSRDRVHMLLTMHKHPQKEETGDFPVAWTNRVGKGRMFYTSLGHREDVYANQLYLNHLTGGMLWALGKKKGDDTQGNPLV
jgi:uncharacterized protein